MKRIKTLKLVIILLLLINIGQVAFFLFSPKIDRNREQARAGAMIQERFGFDEKQMNLFRESRNEHRMDVRKFNRTLEELSLLYYSSIDEKQKAILLDSITVTTTEIYVRMHDHFDEIRAICREDQLPEMDGFVRNLMRRASGRKPPRKKRD